MQGVTLRLLLDQGLPRDASQILSVGDVVCEHVSDIGMSAAEDLAIIVWARAHEQIIVTLDADFHTILSVQNASGPSVIRIRLPGLNGRAVGHLVLHVLNRYRDELRAGCMITVKKHKTTCRLLPKAD
jgi:predicted nuclease of predicted toxin-antitoxin system